jgi:sensor histidine kinase YesM
MLLATTRTPLRWWIAAPVAWLAGSASGWAFDRATGGGPADTLARAALHGVFCGLWIGVPVAQSLARRATARRAEAERARLQAELMSLQAQIEPHFLFNTLATLRSLVRQGSAQALPLLDGITGLLQTALPQVREPMSRVERELQMVEQYLGVMAIRLGPRLRWRVDGSAESLALPIAPLLLQPLVENALRHGVEPDEAGGEVQVSARCDAGRLHLRVRNTGRPLDLATRATTAGNGLALHNLRERLHALHGDQAGLTLHRDTDGATLADIALPLPDKPHADSPARRR